MQLGKLRLDWQAPAACPRATAIVPRVEALLAARIEAVLQHDLRIRVALARVNSGRFRLELELEAGDERWQRELTTATCEQAASAGALMIALAIDPNARPQDTRDQSTPTALTPVAPSTQPPHRTLPAEPKRLGSRFSERYFSANALTSMDLGTLPGISAGPELQVGLRGAAWAIALSGRWLLPKTALLDEASNEGARLELWALALRGCWQSPTSNWRLGLCPLLETGRIDGRSFGAARNASGSSSWWALGLAPIAELRLTRQFHFVASGEWLLPLQRPTFFIENRATLHRPAASCGRFGIGLGLDFR